MDPVCLAGFAGQRAVAPRLPVAWLEGDVLAEYLLFLEETASPPPPMRVPVAWLDGEARDEFLRFLDESRAAAAAAEPEREEEEHGRRAARDGGGHADDRGLVVDDGGFMDGDDDVGSMEEDDEGEDGGVCMEKDEQDAEAALELLLPHILDLPTFRARAAAAPQEPAAPGSPCYQSRWLQLGVCHIEMDSSSSSSSSDQEMSSEEEIEQDASLCDQQLAADSSFRH